jgi:hypothetical protein
MMFVAAGSADGKGFLKKERRLVENEIVAIGISKLELQVFLCLLFLPQ